MSSLCLESLNGVPLWGQSPLPFPWASAPCVALPFSQNHFIPHNPLRSVSQPQWDHSILSLTNTFWLRTYHMSDDVLDAWANCEQADQFFALRGATFQSLTIACSLPMVVCLSHCPHSSPQLLHPSNPKHCRANNMMITPPSGHRAAIQVSYPQSPSLTSSHHSLNNPEWISQAHSEDKKIMISQIIENITENILRI